MYLCAANAIDMPHDFQLDKRGKAIDERDENMYNRKE